MVASLLSNAYRQYEKAIPSPDWESYLKNIVDVYTRLSYSELIVAESNNILAGTVTFYPEASVSGQEVWPRGWAKIRLLAVHPDYRKKGIGRSLINECIRRCRTGGISTIGLYTSQIMDTACSLYKNMGFIKAPEYNIQPTPSVHVTAYILKL